MTQILETLEEIRHIDETMVELQARRDSLTNKVEVTTGMTHEKFVEQARALFLPSRN